MVMQLYLMTFSRIAADPERQESIMGMFQKILNLWARMGRTSEMECWAEDPFHHPDIMAMDEGRIADLPLSLARRVAPPLLPGSPQQAKRPASAP